MYIAVGALVALPCHVGAQAAAGEELPAGLQFKRAYELLEKGDRLREQNKAKEALAAYKQSIDSYYRLSKKFPDWQTPLVKFRIAYCANQIETLLRVVGDSADETPVTETPTTAADERPVAVSSPSPPLRRRHSLDPCPLKSE